MSPRGASSGGSSDENLSSDSGNDDPACCAGPSKPSVVPKGNPFWHTTCCCRFFFFFFGYFALMLGCLRLVKMGRQDVGLALLTIGPTIVIICCFFSRYRFSVTARQITVTFLEAICWMVPLLFLIGYIDMFNDRFLSKEVEVSCTLPNLEGAQKFIALSSWAAECSQEFADPNGTRSLVHHHCPARKEGQSGVWVLGDGSMTDTFLGESINASFWTSLGKNASHSGMEVVCPETYIALQDLISGERVKVSSISKGSAVVSTSTRESLAGAYTALCSNKVEANGVQLCGQWGSPEEDVSITFAFPKKTIAHSAFMAYFRAGFCEELLKYGAVRRVLFKDRVVDCGGLVVYGLAAGAGFATAENVQYTSSGGMQVALLRMYLSIPLHCCTGLIIGIHLGYRKFLGKRYYCLVTLMVPVLVHGTYDFVLMLPASLGLDDTLQGILGVCVLLAAFLYCRCAWLPLDAVCVVNVRKMERQGRVSHPRCCCCECDCCTAWLTHQDPLVKEQRAKAGRQQSLGRSSTAGSLGDIAIQSYRSVVPAAPNCQTTPIACPGCSAPVRAQNRYPSFCPHCAELIPEMIKTRDRESGSDGSASE
mmetsp:Transcript_4531/g.12815  ORF Transcript_4531/g.12815 Transcript_4531/m.12815 type:complete len:593 (+) Transcript_4531:86-1864(+)